jgi:hypothetical protein
MGALDSILLLVAGAVLGVVFGAVAEDWLKTRISRVGRRLRHKSQGNPTAFGNSFRLGPLVTDCVIVEGDGGAVIDEASIYVAVNPKLVELPDELRPWLHEVEVQQEALRAEGRPHAWNGENYALERLSIARNPVDERPELFVRLRHADFYTTLAAQQLDRVLPSGLTVRQKYVEGKRLADVPTFLSCSLSASMAVVTSDGQLLLSKRSEDVSLFPGLWGASATEGVSRTIDSQGRGAPNLYDVARRGLSEELAISATEVELSLLGAAVATTKHLWTFVFIARLRSLSAEQLRERWSRGSPDAWEHAEHAFVKFEPRYVVRHVIEGALGGGWASWTPVVYYLALVNEFGRERTERAIAEVSRDLTRSKWFRHIAPATPSPGG